ncbi:unnamed protein product, partial [Oppiella nova]
RYTHYKPSQVERRPHQPSDGLPDHYMSRRSPFSGRLYDGKYLRFVGQVSDGTHDHRYNPYGQIVVQFRWVGGQVHQTKGQAIKLIRKGDTSGQRIIQGIYFTILFISCVIGLSLNRQIGSILVFSMVFSLLLFICCNCGQCNKTRVISGHVLVGPPNLTLHPHLQQEQVVPPQIAYIIVAPASGPTTTTSAATDDSPSTPEPTIVIRHAQTQSALSPLQPLYPAYYANPMPFNPPPSYDESQRQYK